MKFPGQIMNKIIKNKNNADNYAFIAVILYLINMFYYSLMDRLVIIQAFLYGAGISLCFLSILSDKYNIKIHKKLLNFMSGWLLILLFFVFFRSWWSVNDIIRWSWSIFIVFCICHNFNRLTGIYKAVIIIGFPHVIATLIFFFFRNLYPVMYSVFGKWPSGTKHGQYGFRAGISNHYSLNGIYIAIIFLCCFAYTFSLYKKREKNFFIFSLITMITFFSLVLTMKRAHILFSLAAIILGMLVFTHNITYKQILIFIIILRNYSVPRMKDNISIAGKGCGQ